MSTVVARTFPTGLLVGLGAVVFLANAGLLVLQLLAGRFLAPFVGSSVETWTCVIGVFLTGIALGNHFGGRIADRSPATKTLALLLIIGAISSLSLILWWMVCQHTGFDQSFGLGPRIPVLAILFCLPPAFVLSLITPLTIKLMLPDVSRAGRIAGLVFALSTLGCLVGNYATGFWLMADYTINTISIGVAIGLAALAAPMLLMNYRLAPSMLAADSTSRSQVQTTAEDPLGFRRNMRRAFAVVFLASFCGMSLELTGFRVLAPVLGISLFTWTGIIGVMLAGTACGNYLGGVLADRGSTVAIRRIAIVIGTAAGFAAGPALVRSLRFDDWPAQGKTAWWIVRIAGAFAGFGLVALANSIARLRRGQIVNLFAIGAAIGFLLAHPVVQSFGRVVGMRDDEARFQNLNALMHFDIGSLIIHLCGAVVGGSISLGLLYDPPKPGRPVKASSPLATCLFSAAVLTGLVVLMSRFFQNEQIGVYYQLTGKDIMWTVLTWTFILFFLPMLCLGMISPQVIRLSIPDTVHAGRVSGTIYAWSTAGAIVGTFVTGYFLIDWLGTARVLFLLSLVLLGMSFVIGKLWKNTPYLFVGSMVGIGGMVGMAVIGVVAGGYTMESKYYAINVRTYRMLDEDGAEVKVKALDLDHLMHSFIKLGDPTWLGYKHEYVQGELARYALSRGKTDVLIIGGGGYTFPRWLEIKLPEIGVEVVEIDPAVTEVAHREMGLPRDTKIRTINMDGRQFIRERAKKGHYQLVMQDAVNDLSVPYHLLTKEYNDAIKKTLAPDGAYLLTLIDSIEDGELWRAAVHTMRETFPYVVILGPQEFTKEVNRDRNVFIVYGSSHPLDLAKIRAVAEEAYAREGDARPARIHVLQPERMETYLSARPKIVLTDQYAPVDNLMSQIFRDRDRGQDRDR